MNCGYEPGGENAQKLCVCPAAIVERYPDGESNSGECLGRRCWRIAGTLCKRDIQGAYAKKISSCRNCPFYKKVKEEEGDNFTE